MTVTDIQPITNVQSNGSNKPKNTGRYKIYIDGEFAFALYKSELNSFKIKVGESISEEVRNQIEQDVLDKRAKLRAMNLLTEKSYTVKQLREKLEKGFYPESAINSALDYVASFHYTDDLQYAKDYITYHTDDKSRKRIEQDLTQKGISRELIEQAFMDLQDSQVEVDEIGQIQHFLEKKHFDVDNFDYKEKQKIIGALYRKGISMEAIRKCMQVDM